MPPSRDRPGRSRTTGRWRPTRRGLLGTAGSALAAAVGGCLGGTGDGGPDDATDAGAGTTTENGTTTAPTTHTTTMSPLSIETSAFESGEPIPERYTCDGADVSPPLAIDGVPDGADSLALVVDDPDAPGGTFTHWLVWNLPTDTDEIPADVPASETPSALGSARQGTNDFGEVGYRGPCPPVGDGPHTYRFTLSALDSALDVTAGANRSALADAMGDRTVATARSTGTYER